MPLPSDLSEPALAEWLRSLYYGDDAFSPFLRLSRAVLSLVEAKVREAIDAKHDAASICDKGDGWIEYDATDDQIVSRVLGGA